MEPIIRQAVTRFRRKCIEEASEVWLARYADLGNRLHISDLGKCPRIPFLRSRGLEPAGWSDYQIDVLYYGNVIEDVNLAAIRYSVPEAKSQVVIFNDIWAGSTDFDVVLADGQRMLVEHKTTSEGNFRGRRLPYNFHVLQVMGYAHLMQQDLEARLYYDGRGHWAEFVVWQGDDFIAWEGLLDGKYSSGSLQTTIQEEMAKLEQYWPDGMPPVLPDPFESEYTFPCAKRMRRGIVVPKCRWFQHCWQSDGQDGLVRKNNQEW